MDIEILEELLRNDTAEGAQELAEDLADEILDMDPFDRRQQNSETDSDSDSDSDPEPPLKMRRLENKEPFSPWKNIVELWGWTQTHANAFEGAQVFAQLDLRLVQYISDLADQMCHELDTEMQDNCPWARFDTSRITDDSLEYLAKQPYMTRNRTYMIKAPCQFGMRGMVALGAMLSLRQSLTDFHIEEVNIGDDGCICILENLPHCQKISFIGVGLRNGKSLARALETRAPRAFVSNLVLDSNHDLVGLKHIVKAARYMCGLKVLYVCDCGESLRNVNKLLEKTTVVDFDQRAEWALSAFDAYSKVEYGFGPFITVYMSLSYKDYPETCRHPYEEHNRSLTRNAVFYLRPKSWNCRWGIAVTHRAKYCDFLMAIASKLHDFHEDLYFPPIEVGIDGLDAEHGDEWLGQLYEAYGNRKKGNFDYREIIVTCGTFRERWVVQGRLDD